MIEAYGVYNPASGGTPIGSLQSDGATYDVYTAQRVQQPSIQGTQTFTQYFSVRRGGQGRFGNVNGTVTTGNHFDYWASWGLPLGNFDYMVMASEGYQSGGSADITVSEAAAGGNSGNNSGNNGASAGDGNGGSITVCARGTQGDEHVNLLVGGNVVADWTLGTLMRSYTYTGGAAGDVNVEYDNDASGRDVILDYVVVNGETRQAEDMEYNTATFDGECGGGAFSETMHCSGVIGFGATFDCFSGSCN